MNNQTLWNVCQNQFFRIRLSIRSEDTRKQYKIALDNFSTSIGRTPDLDDLSDDNLAILCHWLTVKGLAPITINERVGRIKTLWTWLARRGMIRTFPTIERIPTPESTPRAWTADELRRLFDACAKEQGFVAGVPAGAWWLALHSWLWCTSERCGATLSLRWEHLDIDGQVAVLPAAIRKGRKKPAVYDLWPECCSLLRSIRSPERDLVFPWHLSEASYYLHYGKILRRAGLPDGRHNKTHAMRVTHATWREATGGNASQSLGHADPATTRKHYLDPRITRQSQPPMFSPLSPPQLPVAG